MLAWVEFIGLPQYRRTFAHNAVDGELLVHLGHDELREDLRIDALGHRTRLLQEVKKLKRGEPPQEGAAGPGGSAGRPASAPFTRTGHSLG